MLENFKMSTSTDPRMTWGFSYIYIYIVNKGSSLRAANSIISIYAIKLTILIDHFLLDLDSNGEDIMVIMTLRS